MFISGLTGENRRIANDYMEGLGILASMRLCAKRAGAVRHPDGARGYQSIQRPDHAGGRLFKQRELAYDMLTAIPGVSCVKPQAALYMFPKLDRRCIRSSTISSSSRSVARERTLLVRARASTGRRPIISA